MNQIVQMINIESEAYWFGINRLKVKVTVNKTRKLIELDNMMPNTQL